MQNAFSLVKSKSILESCKMQSMKIDDDFDTRPDEAKRLTEARIARGFRSVKEAVDFFGWVYESYVQHENGLRGIKKQAFKYAKAYNVSPGWLLTGEGVGPDGNANSIDAKIQHLPADKRQQIESYVQFVIESSEAEKH